MDAMYSAIKGRRGGMLNDMEENAHQTNDEPMGESVPSGQPDMQGLVESLKPEQKQQLLAMLVKDQAQGPDESNPAAIQEGAMGKGEMAELEQGAMDDEDGHESEEQIMESMVSSADSTRADQGATPRNLGERVKMNLATKLKNKGKG